MSLVCYFDIGNTRAKFWLVRGEQIVASSSISHSGDMSALLASLPDEFAVSPDAVRGASVLDDESERALMSAVVRHWGCKIAFARSSCSHSGVVSGYLHSPQSLGIDRWLALIALRPLGKCVCVVDCGSAITLDVLGSDGVHLGGYILPGFGKMADILLRETRRVRFDAESQADGISLGRSTGEGVMHGAFAAIVALVERVSGQYGADIVLTGGDAARLSAFLDYPHRIEPLLLLQGLQRYFMDAGIN